MAKFHFYLKNKYSKGPTSVFLYVRSNGERLKYYTGQSVNPKFWNFITQRAELKPPIDPEGTDPKEAKNILNKNLTPQEAKESFRNVLEFNTRLNDYQSMAEKAANRLLAELNSIPTTEQIKNEFDKVLNVEKPKSETMDFVSFFEFVAEQTKIRTNAATGKPLSPTRCKSLKQTIGVIKNYKAKTRVKVDFENIDRNFYDSFKNYLEKELKLSANTIGKHIKHIKTVLNEATELGINTNLRYKSKHFKVITEPANNIYLNESELKDLRNLDLSKNNRLAKVRDLFLIGCWTGLRFSDFTRLTDKSISTDEGNHYFNITTQKTETEVSIPIFPELMPVLNQYGGVNNLSLPKGISNQKMNNYLKELAEKVESLNVPFNKDTTKAGIKLTTNKMKWELMSTHTARRSFATNMYNRLPDQVSLIMAITGHKTEAEFYKYIKMKPESKAKLFRQKFFNPSPLKIAQ